MLFRKGGAGDHIFAGIHMERIDGATAGASAAEGAVFIGISVSTGGGSQRRGGDHTAESSADTFFCDEMLG